MTSYILYNLSDLGFDLDPAPGGKSVCQIYDLNDPTRPLVRAFDHDPYRAIGLAMDALIRRETGKPLAKA